MCDVRNDREAEVGKMYKSVVLKVLKKRLEISKCEKKCIMSLCNICYQGFNGYTSLEIRQV